MADAREQAMLEEIAELDKQAAADGKPEAKEEPKKEEPKAPEKAEEPKVIKPKSDDQQPVERKIYTMPVSKHTEQLDKLRKKHDEEKTQLEAQIRADYESKLQSLQKNGVNASETAEETDELIGSFAQKYELDESVVKGLLDIAEKRISKKLPTPSQVPTELLSEFEALKKDRELREAREQATKDFDEKVLPIIKKQYPDATLDHLHKVKESLLELAFTDKYHTYALEDIYAVKQNEFAYQSKVSAEPSRGGHGSVIDYDSVTDEQLKNMSVEEADKYFEYMSKKGSRYIN